MTTYSGDFCARFRELLPLHALGAPLGEDAPGLREHLEGCAACRREMDEHREGLALLPYALEPIRPSPAVRRRLLEQVETGPAPPAVPLAPRPRSSSSSSGPPPEAQAPPPRRLLTSLALAASVTAACVLGALLLREHRLRAAGEQQVALLRARIDDVQAQRRSYEQRLEEAEQQLRFLHARSVQFVSLTPPSESEAGASGRILWDQERRAWLFLAFRLPPPPPDRDYQLWFLVKGEGSPRPISAGVASQLPTGDLEVVVNLPPDLGEIKGAALTLERKGGSDRPTSDPLLYGQL